MTDQPFWKTKKLTELTREEWESLCDGCARCCLHKLEDEDTGEIFITNVVCRLLNLRTLRCSNYPERSRLNPECLQLTPDLLTQLRWMPHSCAYRLLAEGKDLPAWHHLVCGDREEVHRQGISVRNKVLSESEANMDALEDYIVGEVEDTE